VSEATESRFIDLRRLRSGFSFLLPYFRPYRLPISLGFASLLLKNIAGASMPLIIKAGVDSLQTGFVLSTTLQYCLWMVLVMAVKGFFQYWMRVLLMNVSRDVEFDMRNNIFTNLVRLSGDFYARTRTGDVLARATNDLNAVRMMAGPAVMYWTETVSLSIVVLGIMFSADWRLTLAALLPAPIVSLVVMVLGAKIHTYFQQIQEKFSTISSMVQENLQGVRVIRAYAQEEAECSRFADLNKDYIHDNLKLARVSGLFMPALEFLIGISFLMVLAAGSWRMLNGQLTVGEYVMFNSYMGLLVWPMIAMGWVVNLTQRGLASLERIRSFLDEQPSITDPPADAVTRTLNGRIRFEQVTLRYGAAYAVRDITLEMKPGETLAIVGPTGSGKTTLANMIPRLIEPTTGTVTLDGVDVKQYALASLRSQIAVVPQETFLFSASLGENIAFGVPGASEETIRRAAEKAGLAPDLETFPDGLETRVGERGLTLSGGQKQRVAIARALLVDPRILILDDALASVDNITEEKVLASLREVMQNRTTILISHRVSTVKQADRVVVLREGSIVEQGKPDELVAQGGYFADLCKRQEIEAELEAIS